MATEVARPGPEPRHDNDGEQRVAVESAPLATLASGAARRAPARRKTKAGPAQAPNPAKASPPGDCGTERPGGEDKPANRR